MMMALDMFAFEIGTLPYQELQRKWAWRHAQSDRFGALPAAQFVGPGPESISLTGSLIPGEGIGSYTALKTLVEMADTGEAYSLVSGVGEVLGDYFIRSIDQTQSLFFVDGMARKSDFTVELERAA
jgi:hypothetical protein